MAVTAHFRKAAKFLRNLTVVAVSQQLRKTKKSTTEKSIGIFNEQMQKIFFAKSLAQTMLALIEAKHTFLSRSALFQCSSTFFVTVHPLKIFRRTHAPYLLTLPHAPHPIAPMSVSTRV